MNMDDIERSRPGWERQALERLVESMLAEKRSARRWGNFWRLVWLGLLAGLVWMVMVNVPNATVPSTPHTAVVEIKGEIAAEADANAVDIVDALRAAFEDAGSQAVVMLINSPGGSPVQAGVINDEVNRLKALHRKPVYAVVEDTCASAAYYVAASADHIYVD